MSYTHIPAVGDQVAVGTRYPRIGHVTKVLAPKDLGPGLRSPGGFVVENDDSKFYVAPWERIMKTPETILTNQ